MFELERAGDTNRSDALVVVVAIKIGHLVIQVVVETTCGYSPCAIALGNKGERDSHGGACGNISEMVAGVEVVVSKSRSNRDRNRQRTDRESGSDSGLEVPRVLSA